MSYIYIINGPNLNLLGMRETEIYGTETLKDVENICNDYADNLGYNIRFLQSNNEGDLINFIHAAIKDGIAIIINAGAYSHTSIAILDALKIFSNTVIEIHISNIHKREDFRKNSYCSLRANAVISGCGIRGYVYAIDYAVKKIQKKI